MARVDSLVPLMYHDPDRSWITDPDPDHPKGTHPNRCFEIQVLCFDAYFQEAVHEKREEQYRIRRYVIFRCKIHPNG